VPIYPRACGWFEYVADGNVASIASQAWSGPPTLSATKSPGSATYGVNGQVDSESDAGAVSLAGYGICSGGCARMAPETSWPASASSIFAKRLLRAPAEPKSNFPPADYSTPFAQAGRCGGDWRSNGPRSISNGAGLPRRWNDRGVDGGDGQGLGAGVPTGMVPWVGRLVTALRCEGAGNPRPERQRWIATATGSHPG